MFSVWQLFSAFFLHTTLRKNKIKNRFNILLYSYSYSAPFFKSASAGIAAAGIASVSSADLAAVEAADQGDVIIEVEHG